MAVPTLILLLDVQVVQSDTLVKEIIVLLVLRIVLNLSQPLNVKDVVQDTLKIQSMVCVKNHAQQDNTSNITVKLVLLAQS
jgi:hypothetical protein